jgi:hypothetical protein
LSYCTAFSRRFLRDAVLLELLVEVAAGRADHLGGLRDVPVVLAQLLDEERALGRLLELAQRAGALALGVGARRLRVDADDVAQVVDVDGRPRAS